MAAAAGSPLVHDGWSEVGADDSQRTEHEAYWQGYLADLRESWPRVEALAGRSHGLDFGMARDASCSGRCSRSDAGSGVIGP